MSTTRNRLALLALAAVLPCAQAGPPDQPLGLGSTPSAAELAQFVSPLADGRGLPPGSGSVAQGKSLYATHCMACHGEHLEGGIGDRLIGGRGTLVNSDPAKKPVKTVESYWPYATTLFDYIKRAMPLNAPGSLSNDEVYALSAYILSEARIVDPGTTLGPATLAKVKMPNRDGFIADQRPDHFARPPAKAR